MERLLAGHRAAGVAVDPRNGDVLALASQPEFDPNVMSPAVPRAYWRELQSNPDRPLLTAPSRDATRPEASSSPAWRWPR